MKLTKSNIGIAHSRELQEEVNELGTGTLKSINNLDVILDIDDVRDLGVNVSKELSDVIDEAVRQDISYLHFV
jgi:hypothetical protein